MAEQPLIIEGRRLEKFYSQPDGHRIEVIAPTDIAIYPDRMVSRKAKTQQ